MTWDVNRQAVVCDGCRTDIALDQRLVSIILPNAGDNQHYHYETCWQTGWYTGIEPKGEWPIAEPVDADPVNSPLYDERLRRFGWTVTPAGCWEWNGSRVLRRGGYGQVRIEQRTLKTHRVAYEAWVGPIREGQFVCHSCDNPPCINPDHLWLGTPADNNWDKVNKGRASGGSLPGESSPSAVLNEVAVLEIRRRLAAGEGLTIIARDYGVTKQNIARIRDRKTWKHL